MNSVFNRKIIAFILTAIIVGVFSACHKQTADNVRHSSEPTPTAAFNLLYNSVKAKNIDDIKSVMTENTLKFIESQAQRQNVTVEKVLENGLTATTFSSAMPEIRDERIKDNMGAIEVWNSKDSKWEDLPFINENGGWKLAIGDVFGSTYKSPGKGRAQLETEANPAATISPDVPTNINEAIPKAANVANKSTNSK